MRKRRIKSKNHSPNVTRSCIHVVFKLIIVDSVQVVAVSRGRGQKSRAMRAGVGHALGRRLSNSGSSTFSSLPPRPGGLGKYEKIPQSARLLCDNTLWVNNRGDVLSE